MIVGTERSAVHVLALPSLQQSRIINPPPTNNNQGPITFLATLLRPSSDFLEAGFQSESGPSPLERPLMSGGMGRVVRGPEWAQSGGHQGRKAAVKVGSTADVRELLSRAGAETQSVRVGSDSGGGRESELAEELAKVRAQLAKAVGLNEAMWNKVVQAGLDGP